LDPIFITLTAQYNIFNNFIFSELYIAFKCRPLSYWQYWLPCSQMWFWICPPSILHGSRIMQCISSVRPSDVRTITDLYVRPHFQLRFQHCLQL